MAKWSNLNLQNSSSPLMEQLIFFHDHTLIILLMSSLFCAYLMNIKSFNNSVLFYL